MSTSPEQSRLIALVCVPCKSLLGQPSPPSARGSGVGAAKPEGPRPDQGARRAASAGRARPAGSGHTRLTWARSGAQALSTRAAAGRLSPTPARVGQFQGRSAPSCRRRHRRRCSGCHRPGLQQIAGERLREAPVQPWRDRRNRRSASNSFPAGGATALRARDRRAEMVYISSSSKIKLMFTG